MGHICIPGIGPELGCSWASIASYFQSKSTEIMGLITVFDAMLTVRQSHKIMVFVWESDGK